VKESDQREVSDNPPCYTNYKIRKETIIWERKKRREKNSIQGTLKDEKTAPEKLLHVRKVRRDTKKGKKKKKKKKYRSMPVPRKSNSYEKFATGRICEETLPNRKLNYWKAEETQEGNLDLRR